jgi:hypothetical protein
MEQVIDSGGARLTNVRADESHFSGKSAASWPAIFAGAFVAVSVSLVLIALGSGLGFAEVSPWQGHGVSATTFTVTTAIWLIVTQWLSACARRLHRGKTPHQVGGYPHARGVLPGHGSRVRDLVRGDGLRRGRAGRIGHLAWSAAGCMRSAAQPPQGPR